MLDFYVFIDRIIRTPRKKIKEFISLQFQWLEPTPCNQHFAVSFSHNPWMVEKNRTTALQQRDGGHHKSSSDTFLIIERGRASKCIVNDMSLILLICKFDFTFYPRHQLYHSVSVCFQSCLP